MKDKTIVSLKNLILKNGNTISSVQSLIHGQNEVLLNLLTKSKYTHLGEEEYLILYDLLKKKIDEIESILKASD